jgi:hypothetical protein
MRFADVPAPVLLWNTERKLANIRSSSARGVSLKLLASSRPSPVSRLRLLEDLEFPSAMRRTGISFLGRHIFLCDFAFFTVEDG